MLAVNVVELLAEMVSHDTVNSAISGRKAPEAGLVSRLERLALDHGFAARKLPVPGQSAQLLISYERDPSSPWIMFDSHLDTVSVEGMSIDPFAGSIREGKLWGRGACDTKGSGAAMFAALVRYAESPAANNVMLLYSVDEEQGMSGIREFTENHLPALVRRIKAAVVGEPTNLKPVVAHNGVQRFTLATLGVAAHSADPNRGRSAISDMARLILDLESAYIPALGAIHPLTGKAQCSINVIRGGTAVNIIPDRCEVQIDRRTVPGEVSRDVASSLRRHLLSYRERHPQVQFELTPSIETPPLTPHNDGSFLEIVRSTLSTYGVPDEPVGVRYATHAGDLCAAGLSCIVLGPGNIDQGHTKDEWIDIDELETAVPIYFDIMKNG